MLKPPHEPRTLLSPNTTVGSSTCRFLFSAESFPEEDREQEPKLQWLAQQPVKLVDKWGCAAATSWVRRFGAISTRLLPASIFFYKVRPGSVRHHITNNLRTALSHKQTIFNLLQAKTLLQRAY